MSQDSEQILATSESLPIKMFPHYHTRLVPNQARTSQNSMQVYTNRIPKHLRIASFQLKIEFNET